MKKLKEVEMLKKQYLKDFGRPMPEHLIKMEQEQEQEITEINK